MALATPKYILDAHIQDVTLKYRWDDWNVQEMFDEEKEDLHQRFSAISYRANMAFISACGEWVVHRYGLLSDDPEPGQHMEASWAGIIDANYSLYWEPPDDKWIGPVRGALQLAMIFTLEAKTMAYQCADVALRSVYASNFTQYILTNPKPFQEWQERVLQRLEHLYPFNEDDPMGEVVPREVFDPDYDFKLDMTEMLVQLFLLSLNSATNPFLLTPKKMIDNGFKGTPYKFSIAEDRNLRNDY